MIRYRSGRQQNNSNHVLLNSDQIEIWPANLLRAKSNQHARLLSRTHKVLRRKRDGRFLACITGEKIIALVPGLTNEPGLDEALQRYQRQQNKSGHLSIERLTEHLHRLGLNEQHYIQHTGLTLIAEPTTLVLAGTDRYRRPLWLILDASRQWQRMKTAALADDIILEAISGYRSHDYQLGIFERKLARGQNIEQILQVNAAPGFSEHHSGCALDISTPDQPAAEQSFETTTAFSWLTTNADHFGFVMSYPRNNPHGIVYEPWHWCWHG